MEQELKESKYAYVWLMMGVDCERVYMPCLLASIYSVQRSNTKADCVVMVTSDVNQEVRARIGMLTSKIVEVKELAYPVKPLRTERQQRMYEEWINRSFTKYQCLSLVQYKKVILLDADVIMVRNCDYLFDLRAPAGTFFNLWAYPRGKIRNHYLVRRCEPTTGDIITSTMISNALRDNGFCVIATTLLLEPNQKDLDDLCGMLESMKPFGFSNFSGTDEQAISYFYSVYKNGPKKNWTMIDQSANTIPRAKFEDFNQPGRKPLEIIHYMARPKPQHMKRAEYLDLEIFYQIVSEMYDKVERFSNCKQALEDLGYDPAEVNQEPKLLCFICEKILKTDDKFHRVLDCPTLV